METEDSLNWRQYWRESYWETRRPLAAEYWLDPQPHVQGMLTSQYIAYYDDVTGGMICPFNDKLLKPASYELTLGWRCLVEGEERLLDEKSPWLEIPSNSIAFVSMQQVLRLPPYLIGRFDLAIEYIYQGLLLGTGPQVDPGFQGALSCPLHNISNDAIYLRLGMPFAKLDFAKAAPPRDARADAWSDDPINDKADFVSRAKQIDNFKVFSGLAGDWREPIFAYTQGKRPKSSVKPLKDSVEQLTRRGLIGLVTAALTAGAFLVFYIDARTDDRAPASQVSELRERQRLEAEDLRSRIETLRTRLDRQRRRRP